MERVKKGYINIASIWGESRLGIHSIEFSSYVELKNTLHKIELVLKGADVIEMPNENEIDDIVWDQAHRGGYAHDSRYPMFKYAWKVCYKWLKSKIIK